MTDCSRDESLYNCCRDGLLSDSLELIAKGANVNWQNPKENQSTAVFAASFNGHGSIVRALVQSGANVDCCNRDGMFSLFIAAQCVHSLFVVEFFKMKSSYSIGTTTSNAFRN
jgi:ankyrin repeat protein